MFTVGEVEKYIGPSVNVYKDMFDSEEKNKDSQVLNMLLVSLISSDSLITIEDCNRSERELLKLKWALEATDLDAKMKQHWNNYILDGLDICRRDRNEMANKT